MVFELVKKKIPARFLDFHLRKKKFRNIFTIFTISTLVRVKSSRFSHSKKKFFRDDFDSYILPIYVDLLYKKEFYSVVTHFYLFYHQFLEKRDTSAQFYVNFHSVSVFHAIFYYFNFRLLCTAN